MKERYTQKKGFDEQITELNRLKDKFEYRANLSLFPILLGVIMLYKSLFSNGYASNSNNINYRNPISDSVIVQKPLKETSNNENFGLQLGLGLSFTILGGLGYKFSSLNGKLIETKLEVLDSNKKLKNLESKLNH